MHALAGKAPCLESALPGSETALEIQPETELNQPWLVCLAENFAESSTADVGVRRSELRSIKEIENFHAELDAGALLDFSSLQYGKVKIVDPSHAQYRIDPLFVAKAIIPGFLEACRTEPSIQPRLS